MATWDDFVSALEPTLACYRTPPVYVYRGQADHTWSLEPSLLRRVRSLQTRSEHLEIELLLTQEFLNQASLFPETAAVWDQLHRATSIERWAYMQHHGCATRLLDWTASPYVAAYFAVDQLQNRCGALFIVAPMAIEQYREQNGPLAVDLGDESLLSSTGANCTFFSWPQIRPLRVVTQQGNFSAALDLRVAHDDYILQAMAYVQELNPDKVLYRKIVIQPELKPVILQQLRAMNVTPHALFPGLDGLGRSLSDLAYLRASLGRPWHPSDAQ